MYSIFLSFFKWMISSKFEMRKMEWEKFCPLKKNSNIQIKAETEQSY